MGGPSVLFVVSVSLLLLMSSAADQNWYKPPKPRINTSNVRILTTTSTTTSTTTLAPSTTTTEVIDSRALVFPEDDRMPNRLRLQPAVKMPQQVPLDLVSRVNDAEDWQSFFDLVDNVTVVHDDDGNSHFYGEWEDVDARSGVFTARDAAVIQAKQASCQPEVQTVKLVVSDDPTVIYFPTCTRIERCGGCCNSELLECQPTKQETVLLQVVKTQYNSGSKLKYSGKEMITVEKHTACKCQCKVQKSDCNKNQEYNQGACRCDCTNIDDKRKCEAENQIRFWDTGSCLCKCRMSVKGSANALTQCSTGFYFNEDTCKCDPWLSRHSDISGIRAVVGEGGRRPTSPQSGNVDEEISSRPRWSFDDKKDDDEDADEEGKDSRPVNHFKFPVNSRHNH